jgi:hypothetical protein
MIEHANGFARDFNPDAITGQNKYVEFHQVP